MRDRDVVRAFLACGLGLVGGLVGRAISVREERRRLDAFQDEIDQVSKRISQREGRDGQEKKRRARDHAAELDDLVRRRVEAGPQPTNGALGLVEQLRERARLAFWRPPAGDAGDDEGSDT
jgi:hypothetical protein